MPPQWMPPLPLPMISPRRLYEDTQNQSSQPLEWNSLPQNMKQIFECAFEYRIQTYIESILTDQNFIIQHPRMPGWSNVSILEYNETYVKTETGETIHFQSFEEAILVANEIDECNGITFIIGGPTKYVPRPGYYLRVGKGKIKRFGKKQDGTYYDSNSNMGFKYQVACWVKT